MNSFFGFCVVFDRYGLPVNFQAMLLQPNKKNMKKLREVLYELYKHLDSSAAIIDVSLKSWMISRSVTFPITPSCPDQFVHFRMENVTLVIIFTDMCQMLLHQYK